MGGGGALRKGAGCKYILVRRSESWGAGLVCDCILDLCSRVGGGGGGGWTGLLMETPGFLLPISILLQKNSIVSEIIFLSPPREQHSSQNSQCGIWLYFRFSSFLKVHNFTGSRLVWIAKQHCISGCLQRATLKILLRWQFSQYYGSQHWGRSQWKLFHFWPE